MCGIVGIVDFSGQAITVSELERMAGVLAHRGPDGAGVYVDPQTGFCGLAHRRLAVIDLVGGAQPLGNEDGTVWIVYNGECYNFAALRSDLEKAGHRFRTHSDTEVLVHLYEQFGPSCVTYLRGMFALAIWDQSKRQLFLARDRLGKKPLYYAWHRGRFIFASQPKAILQVEGFPRQANSNAITEYLLFGYIPAPASAFEGMMQLPSAHTLIINTENDAPACPQRYWSLPTEVTFSGSLTEAAELVRRELTQAVKMRMVSDVPLGAFLSGGLDSTVVVGLMAQNSAKPITTCSMGFEEKIYNELPYARIVADRWQCDHHEQVVRPGSAVEVEALGEFYDEPFADSSALPTWHLCRMTRGQVTVALSGDGGDEAFGGYDRYRAMYLSRKFAWLRCLVGPLRWLTGGLAAGEYRGGLTRLRRFLDGLARPAHQRYLSWLAIFNPDQLRQIYATSLSVETLWDVWKDDFSPAADAGGMVRQAMRGDGQRYLPGDLNTKVDRASMAFGLEVRCPFEDHKVMELAYSLPAAWRHDGRLSKVILRQVFADLIPPAIAGRPKAGFGVPVGRWFRGELKALFADTVLSPQARLRGWLDTGAVERLWQDHQTGRFDHGHRLWALLMLELWCRHYL